MKMILVLTHLNDSPKTVNHVPSQNVNYVALDMISAPTGLWCDYVLYVFRNSRYLSFRHGYAVPPPSSEGGSEISLLTEAEGMNPFPTNIPYSPSTIHYVKRKLCLCCSRAFRFCIISCRLYSLYTFYPPNASKMRLCFLRVSSFMHGVSRCMFSLCLPQSSRDICSDLRLRLRAARRYRGFSLRFPSYSRSRRSDISSMPISL